MSETFGQRLRRLREAKGWTHEELQQRLLPGSSGNVIKLFESDCPTWNPPVFTIKTIMRFADILGVSVGYLFDGDTPSDAWANTPGKRIRARRDELGLTLDMVSALLIKLQESYHWSIAWIACLESDNCKTLTIKDTDHLPAALGVTPEWILTGAEPKFPPKPKEPDAEWFLGFENEGYMINHVTCGDSMTMTIKVKVDCEKHGSGDMLRKIKELIRTGKMPEET